MRFKRLALAALLSAAWAGAAAGQSITAVPLKNGSGTIVNLAGQTDASGYFHYRDVMEGLYLGAPTAVSLDSSGNVLVTVAATPGLTSAQLTSAGLALHSDMVALVAALGTPLQAGGAVSFATPPTVNLGTLGAAATAANQATQITSLGAIAASTAAGATAAAQSTANGSLASIATNTGLASTAANQATQITSLSAIAASTAASATAANQTTANGSLATVATNTTAEAASLAAISGYTKVVSSFPAITAGVAFGAGLGVFASCTVAGNLVLTAADATTLTVAAGVGPNQYPYAVTLVTLGSPAPTCTFKELK